MPRTAAAAPAQTIADGAALVVDGLLGTDAAAAWRYFQTIEFNKTHWRGYEKAFRLYDGECLVGPTHTLPLNGAPPAMVEAGRRRAGNPLSQLIFAMLARPEVSAFLGRCGAWSDISFASYIYPPGSGLGWHSDTGKAAAFIYYLHPEWHESWGGELLLEDQRAPAAQVGVGGPASEFRDFYAALSDPAAPTPGLGAYVAPLPDRLVLIRGGVRHTIKKVEPAAGEAFRATISGFFVDRPPAAAPEG